MWNVLNIGAEDGRRKGSGKMIDEKVLIERLEGVKSGVDGLSDIVWNNAVKMCIREIKDLASEHNNGWIEELLEAKKNCGEDSDCSECPFGQIEDRCILAELQIENDDGWISCEERLPEETEQRSAKYDPFTLAEVDVEWHMVSDLVNVIVKNYDTDEVFVCDDCTVDGEWANFGSYPFEVLAWQPMPEIPAPYKKGE
jgi:hypothetical protein